MKLAIGTRGSKLALWQANWVADRLRGAGCVVDLRVIKTTGDRHVASAPSTFEAKGIFIKEIEEALLERGQGRIDAAVHSLKDLPVDQPQDLCIAAVPEREDARDALISRFEGGLAGLPGGARVATGSPRRQTQLLALRRDLRIMNIRGNVDTRLRKLDRGECDALVMAAAGLNRLGFGGRISELFNPLQVCPAPGQGAMAIEVRKADELVMRAVQSLDHAPTHCAVRAERAALRRLGGGCRTPIAAYAKLAGTELEVTGAVAGPAGAEIIRASITSPASDPERAGVVLAEEMLGRGARELLAAGTTP